MKIILLIQTITPLFPCFIEKGTRHNNQVAQELPLFEVAIFRDDKAKTVVRQ
jgi:hypothetical protein